MKTRDITTRVCLTSVMPCCIVVISVGCGATPADPNCTDEGRPGIVLALEDATTGARFPFRDIVAIAAEGVFRDTARADLPDAREPVHVAVAYERAGTYTVSVSAAGYATWTATGVRVEQEKNACRHVIPRSLTARLLPQGAT